MIYIVNESKNEVRSERMDRQLHELVKSYFGLESIGISNKISFDSEDSRALEILERTCRFKENSWEVGLLWKTDKVVLPKSKGNALPRLKFVEKRLDRDKVYADMYYREMENRYVEIVEDTAIESERCWYVPHFGVPSESKQNQQV